MELFVSLIICLVCIFAYFLPTVVAVLRRYHNALPVFLVNLFLGWTLLGWLGALIWSCMAKPDNK